MKIVESSNQDGLIRLNLADPDDLIIIVDQETTVYFSNVRTVASGTIDIIYIVRDTYNVLYKTEDNQIVPSDTFYKGNNIIKFTVTNGVLQKVSSSGNSVVDVLNDFTSDPNDATKAAGANAVYKLFPLTGQTFGGTFDNSRTGGVFYSPYTQTGAVSWDVAASPIEGGGSILPFTSNGANITLSSEFDVVRGDNVTYNNTTRVLTITAGDYEILTFYRNGKTGLVVSELNAQTEGADETAPTFSVGPAAESITTTSFNITATLNESGKLYAVALADGATAPSSAEVKAGTASSGGAALEVESDTVNKTSFTLSFTGGGYSASTAYDVYVVGEDAAGNLQASPTLINVTTASLSQLTTPTLSAVENGTTQIDITVGSVANADSYELDWSPDGLGTWTQLATTSGVFNHTVLTAGTQYFYRARAIGSGAFTNSGYATDDATTNAAVSQLTAPTANTPTVISDTELQFTANDPNTSPQETSVELQYDTVNTFDSGGEQTIALAAGTTSRNVTGLTAATTYYARWRHIGNGTTTTTSNWSNIVSSTTDSGVTDDVLWPTLVSGVTITQDANGKIINYDNSEGTWNGNALADQYIPADADGFVYFNYQPASDGTILGLNKNQENTRFNGINSGYEFGVQCVPLSNDIYAIITGVSTSAIDTPSTGSTGDLFGLRRVGLTGIITIEKSTDSGSSWSVIHTFSESYTGALYINANLRDQNAKIYYIKHEGAQPIPLEFESHYINSDNSYLDVVFRKAIWGDNAHITPVLPSDFSIELVTSGGVTSASIASISKTDGTAHSGGELSLRFNLSLTGTADGTEQIRISPASNAVFDINGTAMATSQNTGTINLIEDVPSSVGVYLSNRRENVFTGDTTEAINLGDDGSAIATVSHEIWFAAFPNNAVAAGFIVGQFTNSGGRLSAYQLSTSGRFRYLINDTSAGSGFQIRIETADQGIWQVGSEQYKIVRIRTDKTANDIIIEVDGVALTLAGNTYSSDVDSQSNSYNLHMGAEIQDGTLVLPWDGKIRELHFFNKLLTTQEAADMLAYMQADLVRY